jgi:DNA-directed RNA polymerase specialized sigma24 family protein
LLARQRLPVWLRCVVDGDDVANSAFHSFVVGAREDRFPRLDDREELWAWLACLTVRKAINQVKSAKRQKRTPPGERQPLDEGAALQETRPDFEVMAAEQFEAMIERLRLKDEVLGRIALWKFEAYTHEEIAKKLRCSERRVARKFELIRKILETEGTP